MDGVGRSGWVEGGRLEEGKGGRLYGWKKEAQSRMNVLQTDKIVFLSVLPSVGLMGNVAQSKMNVAHFKYWGTI